MDAGPRIEGYDWTGRREAMLRFGPAGGPVVAAAPPLFEEANRTRALIGATLRRLATLGIGGVLPDLPGQGESIVATVDARLDDWRAAFAAAVAATGARYVVAVRGGALLTGQADVDRQYVLTPIAGRPLVRDLLRARRAAAIAAGERPPGDDPEADGPPLLLAGNLVDRALLRELMAAGATRADRTVRLFPDQNAADRHLAPANEAGDDGDLPRFPAPWTAAEPSADPALATMLADDIAAWIARCGG